MNPHAAVFNPDLLTKLRKQIEYYLSDENLKHDHFFHPIISKEGCLTAELIAGCKKIKQLIRPGDTRILTRDAREDPQYIAEAKDLIEAALEESHLTTKRQGENVWVRREERLPALQLPETRLITEERLLISEENVARLMLGKSAMQSPVR